MTRPILLFFVIVFSVAGCITTAVSPSTTETVENEVTPPIERLKEGFLLVRLRSIEKQMAALRYRRRRTDAYRLRNETKQKNAYTVNAFTEHFDFAPVYFFYSKHSGKIRSNQLDSIVLSNEMLPVAAGRLEGKPFLVAEFAEIQPPANGAGLPALIVLDAQLHQLEDPFPFYVRTSVLGEEGLETEAVKKLNDNLHQYWALAMGNEQ